MTAVLAWGATTLAASTLLMLLVLAVRAPVRRLVGPRLGYALWALPALRMLLPALPAPLAALPGAGAATPGMAFLLAGPLGAAPAGADAAVPGHGAIALAVWLAGAVIVLATYGVRHARFCRALRAGGTPLGQVGTIPVVAAAVDGPLAIGVFRRLIVVPRDFARRYDAEERELALAHEHAHHLRGDLAANWASLVVLAVHWWNPVAWVALGAFRHDQELAADARVLAGRAPGVMPRYARMLATAAGVGALPAASLNPRSDLKGRLMMLSQRPLSRRRRAIGAALLALVGGTALAATADAPAAPAAGGQAVTLGVKPDGAGSYALIVGGRAVAPGASLPAGVTLPADFSKAGGCGLEPTARPQAMVIKGSGATRTYTVMCASAAPAPMGSTLAEGLASLRTMRASVASQPASPVFPESERAHALGAIDRSIGEVTALLRR